MYVDLWSDGSVLWRGCGSVANVFANSIVSIVVVQCHCVSDVAVLCYYVLMIRAQKGSILVNEGTMSIKQVGGRLTNVQYKTMVKRFDELIPLIPMAITLSESTKGVEVPKTKYDRSMAWMCCERSYTDCGCSLLFFVKIDQGELSLCNDYSGCEEKVLAAVKEVMMGS